MTDRNTNEDRLLPLQQPIAALHPGRRAVAACQRLGIGSVGQFLATPRSRWRGIPDGRAIAAQLERAARQWLSATWLARDGATRDPRPLAGLLPTATARRACRDLGLSTAEEFLAMSPERVLACTALGPRAYASIVARLRATAPTASAARRLLPDSVVDLPVDGLDLPETLTRRLHELGCDTVGTLLCLPETLFEATGELGSDAAATLKAALAAPLVAALQQQTHGNDVSDWSSAQRLLLASLDVADQPLLCQRLGLGCPPQSLASLAAANGRDTVDLAADLTRIRARLRDRCPTLLQRLHSEMTRELIAFEGVVTGEHLAAGSLLQAMAKDSRDPQLPLRVCAELFPDDFHLHDDCVSALAEPDFRRFASILRRATAPGRLPVPVEQLASRLRRVVDPVPRGLLLHLLRSQCRLSVFIDPNLGELAVPSPDSLPSRLHRLLAEAQTPTTLDDLVFHYRERFRTANRARIEHHLRQDGRFLEIGPQTWSLRANHQAELAHAAQLADTVAAALADGEGRRRIADLLPADLHDPKLPWLVSDCLRRHPTVRYLGRGEICLRSRQRSRVLDQLLQDFRRAAGEVVLSRFLANQPYGRRRLIQRLLHENRLFVMPAADRVDLLSNYPFNDERLRRLLQLVRTTLDQHGGFARIDVILQAVNQSDLGGQWLTPVLLLELIRRHGTFECLPGDLVAHRELGLGGWLMQRVRATLRSAGVPLDVGSILAERPDLQAFADCLAELLRRDPMIQTRDGVRFATV